MMDESEQSHKMDESERTHKLDEFRSLRKCESESLGLTYCGGLEWVARQSAQAILLAQSRQEWHIGRQLDGQLRK